MTRKAEYTYPKLHNKAWMESALQLGWTYQKIADSIGCSKVAVSLAVRQMGLVGLSTAQSQSHRRYERPASLFGDKETLQGLVNHGMTLAGLAEVFGCSKGTVRIRLAELGVEFPERNHHA